MNRHDRIQKRRARSRRLNLTVLTLLTLVLFVCILLLPSVLGRPSQQPAASSASSSVTARSSAPSSDTENVVWEKQEAPVQLPILMYHAIHVMDPAEAANANLIVAPELFESHIKALQEAGYYFVTPEEAYKILSENVLPRGKKPVWLTFDDSLWDFYDQAYPILKRYKAKGTNNVITGSVGNSGSLTLDQMLEMKKAGMSFQGHTVNHPDLSASTAASQTSELTDSKTYLDSQLGQDTLSLAYPAGRYSADTIAIAEKAGYKMATTTNNGLASLEDGLYSLDRIRILPTTTAESLLQEITVP